MKSSARRLTGSGSTTAEAEAPLGWPGPVRRPSTIARSDLPPITSIAAIRSVGSAPGPAVAFNAATPALRRWSLSTWAFARQGGVGALLAPGGTLGGSQVGARATYALTSRAAISLRFYSPLNRTRGAEAALGLELQPVSALPIRMLAERRQAIGPEGRSAFALLAHGGVSNQPVAGAIRLEAYAQAGMVGLRSLDGFADGAVRLELPVLDDDLRLGVGAWGAVQPRVSRIDVGPHLSYRLPVLNGRMRISADYRVRVAGDARPGSGPAVTLSTDF